MPNPTTPPRAEVTDEDVREACWFFGGDAEPFRDSMRAALAHDRARHRSAPQRLSEAEIANAILRFDFLDSHMRSDIARAIIAAQDAQAGGGKARRYRSNADMTYEEIQEAGNIDRNPETTLLGTREESGDGPRAVCVVCQQKFQSDGGFICDNCRGGIDGQTATPPQAERPTVDRQPIAWRADWSDVAYFFDTEQAAVQAAQKDNGVVTPLYAHPASDEVRRLRNELRKYACTSEYDSPGDRPEYCGEWCLICKRHIDADRVGGHSATCLLRGPVTSREVAPNEVRRVRSDDDA